MVEWIHKLPYVQAASVLEVRADTVRRIRFSLNDVSMWTKLVLCFALVLVIPIGVSVYLAVSVRGIVLRNAEENAVAAAERVSVRTQQALSAIVSVSSSITYNSALIEVLSSDYPSYYEMADRLWKSGDLTPYYRAYEDSISELHLYVDQKYILNTGIIQTASEPTKQNIWYQRGIQGQTLPFWSYVSNENFSNNDQSSLCLTRPVYEDAGILGVLNILVKPELLLGIAAQESTAVLLFAPDRTIVSSTDQTLVGQTADSLGIAFPIEGQLVFRDRTTRAASIPFHVSQTDGDFIVVSIFSDEDLLRETSQVTALTTSLTVTGGLISLLLLFLLSRFLTKRLARVSRDIHRAAGGDLDFSPTVDGVDEIGTLSADLSQMLSNLRKLIREVYEIRLEKQELEGRQKDIQLKVLSSQLNPHFLFNTLESIRMKAVLNGEMELAAAIRMLSSLLRKSLTVGSSPIPLSDELAFVEDYLNIQKFRFEHRLQYKINIFAEISHQTTAPFLLQPLVENAVRHGIEESDRPGFVSVTVTKERGKLILRVADNGAGIPRDTLAQIQRALSSDTAKPPEGHIGLLNVSQRLRLCYGELAELQIASGEGSGTIVTIILPPEGKEEEPHV